MDWVTGETWSSPPTALRVRLPLRRKVGVSAIYLEVDDIPVFYVSFGVSHNPGRSVVGLFYTVIVKRNRRVIQA